MKTMTHDLVAIHLLERYALLDIERRDRKGELRLREEAARTLEARSGQGSLDRVLTGTGGFLMWLGQKLKNCTRVQSPAAV